MKPIAVVDDVEDAGHVDLAATLDLALHDALDEVVLAQPVGVGDLQITADPHQLVDVLAVEFVDIHERGFSNLSWNSVGWWRETAASACS